MKFIKKHYKYYLCFLIILLSLIFFGYNNTDNIWNYGMAHAIHMGEVPYRDFNIITTPLYPFLMNFFLLFQDCYLFFLIGQAILGTVCYYFMDSFLGKKVFFLLPIIGMGLFYFFFPNYNFLVFFFLVLLMYLEKEKKSDYLIGLVLALLILTKHTMGVVVVFFSLLSTFQFSKCFKRIVAMIGPGLLFIFYLLLTKSFSSFWNLSVIGLFDFGGHNNYRSVMILIFAGLCLLYCLYQIKKNPKDPFNYYLLSSFFFLYPIADSFHFQYVIILTLLIVLYRMENIPNVIYHGSIVLCVFFLLFNIAYHYPVYKQAVFSQEKHFLGYLTTKENANHIHMVLEDYQAKENAYMFSFSNMYFDIASNHKITYFDIPLYGNFGYDGVSSMKKKVDSMHDVYFYVQDHKNIQYCDEVYRYIKEKSQFSYKIGKFAVYYKD